MSAPTKATAILNGAADGAKSALIHVDVLSKVLADIMHQIHGGIWSVSINHNSQFILIAQDDLGCDRVKRPGVRS